MRAIVKESFPPNSNPFNHDAYHMGITLGTNVTIMYEKHTNEKHDYVIVINTETGKRLKVVLT